MKSLLLHPARIKPELFNFHDEEKHNETQIFDPDDSLDICAHRLR